ncbi:nucleoside triphosphate pyrophosphohydrolase family protein [Phaeodactylibacter xiamenensis]|jgi:predicted HAD superfamily Cof-like phosphohydrolase|uniref:nucleoside triphosphate pyrophosphohydrolase family protein n=1 Tax=Phaeodactylibacter xiamenensis TaxID=1524460 RepID=UPI0024A7CA61|nr:nucleoside triphosphate pyrophosphohydrolase family protein [Phaeodactylibacter xiamenensis]
MDHPDALRQVAAFHRTFKHPIEPQPTIPDETRCRLRVSLLAEEVRELEQAIADRDLTEIADALCDIQYVLSGAILEFGLADKFKALFEEVQRSNMSKACSTREEAEQTMAYYKTERGFDSYVVEEDGRFLVYRKEDNKTLKSVAYSPADLHAILSR